MYMAASERSLLIIDDDPLYGDLLSRQLDRHGFSASVYASIEEALPKIRSAPPDYAVIDLYLRGRSGLSAIASLQSLNPNIRIVILTGYPSVATAVSAIKLGATNFLMKSANPEEVVAALTDDNIIDPSGVPAQPLSLSRLEWEHIQNALKVYDGNVSATARALRMHRRTLQRKLRKHPARG